MTRISDAQNPHRTRHGKCRSTKALLRRAAIALVVVAVTLLAATTMRTQLLAALNLLPGRIIQSEDHSRTALTFSEAGTFKISIFEDLHFGEDEFTTWAPQADQQTLRVMSNEPCRVQRLAIVYIKSSRNRTETRSLTRATDESDATTMPTAMRRLELQCTTNSPSQVLFPSAQRANNLEGCDW